MNKLLVVVGGPTASGKTDLAILLARRYQTEIISCDSRQFYRELTIGTAKPDPEQLREVRHHFIDSLSVPDAMNAGKFGAAARGLIETLFKTHQVVVMAGGSGLYIDAVLSGIDDLPPADPAIRNDLKQTLAGKGIAALQQILMERDPRAYAQTDIQNPQRLIRALEVIQSTGKPYSSFLTRSNQPLAYPWILTGIRHSRESLYARIDARSREMVRAGLLDETRAVAAFRSSNALQTVGYREMFEHLDGLISLEEAVEKIARNTRNYAKRQMTWFRRYPDMLWIEPGHPEPLFMKIEAMQRVA